VERQLNDSGRANYYSGYAAGLKKSFNKSTEDGGFWSNKNKWYIHWIDKDHSPHGDNLVVPVNLMPLYMAICDDTARRNAILDKIEEQTARENLFFWPLCIFPYAAGEGMTGNSRSQIMKTETSSFHGAAWELKAIAGYKPDWH